MGKATQRTLRNQRLAANTVISTKNVNCANAASTTTKQTPRRNSNIEAQSICIRKCHVRIKRIKIPSNNAAKLPSLGKRTVKGSSNAAPVALADLCHVRIKRIKNASNSAAKLPSLGKRTVKESTEQSSNAAPVDLADPSDAIDPAGISDVSTFNPTRNSTMCLSKLAADASRKGPKRPVLVNDQQSGGTFKPTICSYKQTTASAPKATVPDDVTASRPEPRFFHRDQPPTRTRSAVTRNVFEFLSQSQIEDNEVKDPAADIIKQMVKDGRACVMIRSKTTGKIRARTVKKKVRPVGKRKQCSLRSIGEKEPCIAKELDKPLSPIYEPQVDFSDDENEPNDALPLEVPVEVHAQPQNRPPFEGAYSPLARSLLLNQTKTQNPLDATARRRELLSMAKKFVSTPLNRKSTTTTNANTSKFSPILHNSSNNSPGGGSSPWRVADDAPLPNTFVFGLNTSQLPSYSSDFIRKRHVYVPDEPEAEPEPEPEPVPSNEEFATCHGLSEHSSASAVNDSNGENVPPPNEPMSEVAPVTPIKPSEGQENENVENYVQLGNPRRTLQHRSPLKDINILEVVVLPSWKKNVATMKTPIRESSARNHVQFEHFIDNEANSSPRNLSSRTERQQQQTSNLFGFEDFLSEDDKEHTNRQAEGQNHTLREKLQRLKGMRPANTELPQLSTAPMRHAYDDLEAHQLKQRNIKDMLCSTMVGTPTPRLPSTDESIALFKDIDPETTFDEKEPRRTYVRERPKRKRKQRVHVLFIESDDDSDSDDNEQDSKENNADSPSKAVPKQKRPRKDVEHEAKLQQYITSFNQECDEVEKFPVIVE